MTVFVAFSTKPIRYDRYPADQHHCHRHRPCSEGLHNTQGIVEGLSCYGCNRRRNEGEKNEDTRNSQAS